MGKESALVELDHAARTLHAGSVWKHYKGGTYVIRGHGINTETVEVMVAYQRLAGPGYDAVGEANLFWYRPAKEWLDQIEPGYSRFTRLR